MNSELFPFFLKTQRRNLYSGNTIFENKILEQSLLNTALRVKLGHVHNSQFQDTILYHRTCNNLPTKDKCTN